MRELSNAHCPNPSFAGRHRATKETYVTLDIPRSSYSWKSMQVQGAIPTIARTPGSSPDPRTE
ncbi:hypothetical protein HMPREF0724_11038 [Prescottella equi ATCC 33707]|uniref:Uncharacterized protein n=1 Tax=Prescottella equi ATCC 33707 TaxID=525370 RepID=E9SYN6_RHOHA|nr:hypothetical protein HMPREF0724_11038 [Prescottella equi ATCC 33707]